MATWRLLVIEISQHGPIGFILVLSGIEVIQEGPHGWELALALVSLLAGGALLAAMAREVRALRSKQPHHQHFPWIDLLSAPVVVLEGVHKLHAGLHYIPYCYYAIGGLLLLKALFRDRLLSLRKVRMDPIGLEFKRVPWARRSWRWNEIDAVENDPKGLKLVLKRSPPRTLALNVFENAREAREAILEGFRRWGPSDELESHGAGEPADSAS
jgi:hypothetical protein